LSLKINILLLLLLLISKPSAFAGDKFLRIKGELVDKSTNSPLTDFQVRLVEDEMDSTTLNFQNSTFDLWIEPNHKTKIYFLKEGYIINHILVDASFIPSRAYKKKQRIEDLVVKMSPTSKGSRRNKKPDMLAEYVAKNNGFEVKDMMVNKNQELPTNYSPPFPAPADTYAHVKPTSNQLELTTALSAKKNTGKSELSKILQGVLFADMNYCLFNERTNEANRFLSYLKEADEAIWGNIKDFDSPEYGRIICRTINREQSVDTLFALGAHLETSRLILQDFTSDSKVLIHLKKLRTVLQNFTPLANGTHKQSFMTGMYSLIPSIDQLEDDYKHKLRDKLNFEMKEDVAFQEIQKKVNKIYEALMDL
jgi:hypothetical protein